MPYGAPAPVLPDICGSNARYWIQLNTPFILQVPGAIGVLPARRDGALLVRVVPVSTLHP